MRQIWQARSLCASLFTGGWGWVGRTRIYDSFGGRGGRKSFSWYDNALFFPHGQHCATNSFGATRSPAPAVPSLSLCRLELAGAGTLKFQHGLHIPPNYYALLLRLSSPSLRGAPLDSPEELGRLLPAEGHAAPESCRAAGWLCVLRSFSAPGTNTAESRRLADTHGSTHTVELSRSTFLHTAPCSPRKPGVAEQGE